MDQQLFRGATQLIPIALSAALLSCDSDDDRAFMTELFLNHRQKLLAYAFSICHDKEQSEDAVQDAFVSLIRIIPQLRALEDEHLSGYLLITVRNAVYSLYRKKPGLSMRKRMHALNYQRIWRFSPERVTHIRT